jgi:hypothetical protein
LKALQEVGVAEIVYQAGEWEKLLNVTIYSKDVCTFNLSKAVGSD